MRLLLMVDWALQILTQSLLYVVWFALICVCACVFEIKGFCPICLFLLPLFSFLLIDPSPPHHLFSVSLYCLSHSLYLLSIFPSTFLLGHQLSLSLLSKSLPLSLPPLLSRLSLFPSLSSTFIPPLLSLSFSLYLSNARHERIYGTKSNKTPERL